MYSLETCRCSGVGQPYPIFLFDCVFCHVHPQILQVFAKLTSNINSVLEVKIPEGLFPKMCQLSSDGNGVSYLSTIQYFFTKLADIVFGVVDIDAIFVIQGLDTFCEVSPDFLTLHLAKIVVVESQLDARFESFVNFQEISNGLS